MPTISMRFQFNGETYNKRGTDIAALILNVKPEQMLTDMFVTATARKQKAELHLTLKRARHIFNDETAREVFSNNIKTILSL